MEAILILAITYYWLHAGFSKLSRQWVLYYWRPLAGGLSYQAFQRLSYLLIAVAASDSDGEWLINWKFKTTAVISVTLLTPGTTHGWCFSAFTKRAFVTTQASPVAILLPIYADW